MKLNNATLMGNIYDPETDSQFVLLKVSAKDWDKYQKEKFDTEFNNG